MDSSTDVQTGVKGRVMGVVNKLVQFVFLKYVALFALVGTVTFLGLHYWSDIFKNDDGTKNTLYQALASLVVALVACIGVFFLRLW